MSNRDEREQRRRTQQANDHREQVVLVANIHAVIRTCHGVKSLQELTDSEKDALRFLIIDGHIAQNVYKEKRIERHLKTWRQWYMDDLPERKGRLRSRAQEELREKLELIRLGHKQAIFHADGKFVRFRLEYRFVYGHDTGDYQMRADLSMSDEIFKWFLEQRNS